MHAGIPPWGAFLSVAGRLTTKAIRSTTDIGRIMSAATRDEEVAELAQDDKEG